MTRTVESATSMDAVGVPKSGGSAVKSGSHIKNMFSVFRRNHSGKKQTPKIVSSRVGAESSGNVVDETDQTAAGQVKRTLFGLSPSRKNSNSNKYASPGRQAVRIPNGSVSRGVRESRLQGPGKGPVREDVQCQQDDLIPASREAIMPSRNGGPQRINRVNLHQSPAKRQSILSPYQTRTNDAGEDVDDSAVTVVVRVRPRSQREGQVGGAICIDQVEKSSLMLRHGGHEKYGFAFDRVAGEDASQEDMYEVAGKPVVANCLKGYHACLLAYGQTGSGKTYSMMGAPEEGMGPSDRRRGLIQRCFEDVFYELEGKKIQVCQEGLDMSYSVACTFIEIYNESITDLVNPDAVGLAIRDDKHNGGLYVDGAQEVSVESVQDVEDMLSVGMANRRVAETLANDRSSRSHSVFTANIVQKVKDASGSVAVLRSRLHLVDLAGSERQKASGAAGERLKEASSINKSLSALGLVIMSLVDQQQGKQRHVPYRDSKLTYLLQDALGGTAKTVLLATISPASVNSSETLSTLRFADNAKRIKNRAIINQDAEGDPEELRREVLRLREELSNLKSQKSLNPDLFQITETPVHSIHTNPLVDPSNSVDGVRTEGMRKALVASLRREEDMSRAVAALKEEVAAMDSLLTSKDADLRRTAMILKLKESRLCRQEAHRSNDDDIKALEYELSLLKERNQSHPEVKRFALENVRLKRQIDQANFGGSNGMAGVSEEEFAVLRKEMLQVAKVAEEAQEELEAIRAQAEAAKHVYQDTESKRRESIIRDMDGAERLEFVDIDDAKLERKLKSLQEENDVLRIRLDGLEGEKREHEILCNHAGSLEAKLEVLGKENQENKKEKNEWYDAYTLALISIVDGWNAVSRNGSEIEILRKDLKYQQDASERQKKEFEEKHVKVVHKVEEALKSATALQQEINAKESIIEDLSAKVDSIELEKSEMKEKISKQSDHISQLEIELEKSRTCLSEAEATSTSLTEQVQGKLSIISSLEQEIIDLNLITENLEEKKQSLEKALNSSRASLAAAEMDSQLTAAQLRDKTKEITSMNEIHSDLRSNIISLQEELENSRAEMEYELSDCQATLSETRHNLASVQDQLSTSKRAFSSLEQEYNDLKQRLESRIQHAIAQERAKLQSTIHKLEDELGNVTSRLCNATEVRGPLANDVLLAETRSNLKDAEDNVSFLEKEISSLKSAIKSKDQELAKLKNQMAMEVSDAAQQVQELLAAQARAEKAEARLKSHLARQ
eukprot:jgi/Picsp_1/2193/NSC_05657-R1_kinesin-like protein kif15